MSELRWNPQLGEWLITATHRQDRTFLPPADACALCPTRPGGSPTEIGRSDFEIVVFENRFPSLSPTPPSPAIEGTELTPVRPSVGACEVVVYTPEHDASLTTASVERIERLVRLPTANHRIAAIESGSPRRLEDGAYNARRPACGRAVSRRRRASRRRGTRPCRASSGARRGSSS